MILTAPPVALYVHIPWCVRKCPYCDFNSHQAPSGELPEERYVDALIGDLEHDLPSLAGREFQSIFLGGGTPSLFHPAAISRLLREVAARIPLSSDVEVTMEANPGTIEHGRFEGYRDAGVTRVSLGVQSFDASQLQRLGRIHSPDDVFRSVREIESAGIRNFNLDLMYALPGQTVAEAEEDVAAAIALGPRHISHYQLTMEPGTVFHHRPPAGLPDIDASWDMQVACQAVLARHGYDQYEVSAYARDASRCRHNVNYWEFGDYAGIGAGAHGKLTDVRTGLVSRTVRRKQPREYLQAPSASGRLAESRVVTAQELPFEYMLNALRLRDGFDVRAFVERTGLPQASIGVTLEHASARGLLEQRSVSKWAPTDLGWRFLNDLTELFLA
jgi:putative oxygen-independent coproporphyrinogen III oxidase